MSIGNINPVTVVKSQELPYGIRNVEYTSINFNGINIFDTVNVNYVYHYVKYKLNLNDRKKIFVQVTYPDNTNKREFTYVFSSESIAQKFFDLIINEDLAVATRECSFTVE